MFEPYQSPPVTVTHPSSAAAKLVMATARWLAIDEDVALGCESADPSLQIESWEQALTEGDPRRNW